jgi:hypothetical protein
VPMCPYAQAPALHRVTATVANSWQRSSLGDERLLASHWLGCCTFPAMTHAGAGNRRSGP